LQKGQARAVQNTKALRAPPFSISQGTYRAFLRIIMDRLIIGEQNPVAHDATDATAIQKGRN
jgi:hypothetical protein